MEEEGNIPGNPSEKKQERNAVAGLGAEVGDNLWDFSNPPTDEAGEAQSEREFVSGVA